MALEKNQQISAQVILKSASGKPISGETVITSKNVSEFQASQIAIKRVKEFFADHEFEVGEYLGISFSITASVSNFEKVFSTVFHMEKKGGLKARGVDGSFRYDLPIHSLPKSILILIEAITFTPPPDFGPTEFFGP